MPYRPTALLLTVPEVARELRCRDAAVRQLIQSGRLPAIRVHHTRGWRVRVKALEAYLESLESQPAPAPQVERTFHVVQRKRPRRRNVA